nr:EOG090X0IJO [Sida crystallina]
MTQAIDKTAGTPDLLAADIPVALSHLNEVKNVALSVNQMVRNVINRLKNNELPMSNGMSFLDVKNQMLLKYLLNLNFFVLKKCSGETIKGNPAIERLVEIRTVLERMRPVEHKLKYQIDKLLKIASTGKLGENDPLQFKANPHNLMTKVGDDDESSEDEGKSKKSKSGVYVPPKLAAMPYEGDETSEQRSSKAEEKVRRQKVSSSVLQGLREEFMETPAEIVESSANGSRMKVAQERKSIQEYEETYFTRLPVTRQDRHRSRQMNSAKSVADELIGLSSFREDSGKKRKSTAGSGKKKGKSISFLFYNLRSWIQEEEETLMLQLPLLH